MRKSVKIVIGVYLVLLHYAVASAIVVCVWWWLSSACEESFRMRAYQMRHIEWDSEQILASLEDVFGFDFPEDIRDVKAAKSIPVDGTIFFILKFSGHQDTIDRFLKSFLKPILEFKLTPYNLEDDRRKTCGTYPPPAWFTEPIQQGKQGTYYRGYGKSRIYINTADADNVVVYIEGSSHAAL